MNLKYKIGNQTLRQYCIDNNIKYCNVWWLIKNKHLTPEEALAYNRYPNGHIDRKQQYLRNHRRFLGYSEEDLDKSKSEIKIISMAKKGAIFYHGHTIGYWSKKSGKSKSCLLYRVKHKGMNILQAIKEPTKSEKVLKYNGKSIWEQFDEAKCRRIMDRVKRGWSVDSAVNVPKISQEQITKRFKEMLSNYYKKQYSLYKARKEFYKKHF